jgi:hypothetical protein
MEEGLLKISRYSTGPEMRPDKDFTIDSPKLFQSRVGFSLLRRRERTDDCQERRRSEPAQIMILNRHNTKSSALELSRLFNTLNGKGCRCTSRLSRSKLFAPTSTSFEQTSLNHETLICRL